MKLLLASSRFRSSRHAISITETLLAIALLSIVTGFVLIQTGNLTQSTQGIRRSEATAVLNSAVAAYLKNGGTIPPGSTGETVLAKLKTKIDAASERYFVGFKGPFIDVRIKGRAADVRLRSPRIAWNDGIKQFCIKEGGPGWSEIYFDSGDATADHGTEARTAFASFARDNPWVWDYTDTSAGRRAVRPPPTASPHTPQPELPGVPSPLLPPVINPDTGIYDHRTYPLTLTISDPNPPGAADIVYRVDGGAWQIWPGGQSAIPKSLTTAVNAFARAREGDPGTDSAVSGETYTTYFLRGTPTGEFVNPQGDSRMAHAIESNGIKFRWGKTESPGHSMSELDFLAADVFEAGPGESFTVGTVVYRNGVTRAGTNARTITLRMDMTFAVPASGLLTLEFPVRILNSVHYPWTSSTERRDYIWLPQELLLNPPLTVLNRNFSVRLTLSAPDAVIEGSDLKIAVAENTSASISLQASVETSN